jgi:Arc/MetJ family transcription regulator
VTRTNIDIDDELIANVMRRYALRTKREAVDFALRRLYRKPLTTEEILALEGTGWGEDGLELSDLRRDYVPIDE